MKPQKKALPVAKPKVAKKSPAAILRREMKEITALMATLPKDMSFVAELAEVPVQEGWLADHLLPTTDKRLLRKRAFLARALRLDEGAPTWGAGC